jgi:hypothetical protein
MSVVKSKRGESDMEFIHTARELQIYTIKKCAAFPKRYTFYINQPIAELANRIYTCVVMANSIYPTNAHEVQLRRDYLLKANATLYSLVSQIETAHEIFGLETRVMKYWMTLVNREIRLIKGVLKKDKARYKNIC